MKRNLKRRAKKIIRPVTVRVQVFKDLRRWYQMHDLYTKLEPVFTTINNDFDEAFVQIELLQAEVDEIKKNQPVADVAEMFPPFTVDTQGVVTR